MKKFSFPLERVLGWRQTQSRLEEAKLDQLHSQVAALDRSRLVLDKSILEASQTLVASRSATALEIGALEHFRAATARQAAQLARGRLKLEQAIAHQMQVVMVRRRETKLLEQLRERRLAEWHTSEALEGEQLAAESYLARTVRQMTTRQVPP